jgi:formate-dependent nitrite reductase membrane component NrfD
MRPPASTLFTASPEWQTLVILYFFIGGIAGGSYFLATLLDLFGRPIDRPLARMGYYTAFPATVVCGLLLTFDLGRPTRFWHMLLQSERMHPILKPWSPMSVGAWALLIFGGFSLVSFLAALADGGRLRAPVLVRLRPPTIVGVVISVLGAAMGFFIAGYTGVLLSVTNRPIWADTNFVGVVFLASAASTAAALLVLLAFRRGGAASSIHALERFDTLALVLELIALIALVASLGGLLRLWLNAWGALLLLGVVLAGIIAPLFLRWRARGLPGPASAMAAVLVLIGGLLLRIVVVLSSEGV